MNRMFTLRINRVILLLSALAVVACCNSAALAGNATALWRFGSNGPAWNDSAFAMAPGGWNKYVGDGYYIVGITHAKQTWPYVEPGPSDPWANNRQHTFSIIFGLKRLGGKLAALNLRLVSTQAVRPPKLRISVNDQWSTTMQTTAGTGDASMYGHPKTGHTSLVRIIIPISAFHIGANKINITTVAGSWLLYHSVSLQAPPKTLLAPVTGSFLDSAAAMTCAEIHQPLLDGLPMVGTGGHGHAYPGASVPFGMVQLSPDTRTTSWDGCSGFYYSDPVILGFSHTHLSGTGATALGDVLIMPTVGKVYLDAGMPGNGYASTYSPWQEYAQPGYYRVFLNTPRVTAELTATTRCGMHRYTFPASQSAHIVLDLVHGIDTHPDHATLHIVNDHTITGMRIANGWGGDRNVYFVIKFSRPFKSFGIQQDGRILPAGVTSTQGRDLKAWFNYTTRANEKIVLKVALSNTGVEGAERNLAAEIHGWNFDAVRAAAARQWHQEFTAVQIKSFDPHVVRTFYANLYLADLAPTLFNDDNGWYRGYDHRIHKDPGFQNYTTFSVWDIYRTEWPLLMVLQPARVNDMVKSLMSEYTHLNRQTLPIWPLWSNETGCMIGYHSVDMIAAAYLNGFRGFNAPTALDQMVTTADNSHNVYRKLGYVPESHGVAASKTIEYSFDDWCVARMAEALGHKATARRFYRRAANYYNIFDTTTGFFRSRHADGRWYKRFDPIGMVNSQYVEADAWQYLFAPVQDVPGLIKLLGGKRAFVRRLDELFTTTSEIHTGIPDLSGRIGQYVGGDEQSVQIAYLYDYGGAAYKAQYWARYAMTHLYSDTPAGEPGNIDCGEMAAWYVFSALGLYPVNPDSGILAIGSPIVTKAVIHLSSSHYHGNTFTIIAKNNNPKNIYIQSASLNGKPLSKPWITLKDVFAGGTLKFIMGPTANVTWGDLPADAPPPTMPAGLNYPPVPPPSHYFGK